MKQFIVIFVSVIFIISCQTTRSMHHVAQKFQKIHPSEKDSAPLGPIPTFFKSVIPKSEPLSRYGNPSTYKVEGRQYSVMRSARGYKQRGLASWYGTKFHSRRTSSGEHYNMYELTAAHRTLPLPTYVRVKNLDNGKIAIVKINDRGPFHKDRLIDLSYGAAVKLGIFPKGTANVEIETVTGKHSASLPEAHYYVQAGAFTSKSTADILRNKIKHLIRTPVIVKQEKRQYIVRVGPLNDKRAMERIKATLNTHGIKGSFSVLL